MTQIDFNFTDSKSQCAKLLAELKKKRRLTKLMMLNELGILNGGGRAWDLKHGKYDGFEYPVEMEMVPVKTREGRLTKVAEYFLDEAQTSHIPSSENQGHDARQ